MPLFTPGPGTVIKDLDVVGNHCVLVAKTPADHFILVVFPLASPEEVHTVQVSSTQRFPSSSLAALFPDLLLMKLVIALASLLGLFPHSQEARRGTTGKWV